MLKLQTALGALKIIKKAEVTDAMASVGITEANLRQVKSSAPWVGQDKANVQRTMDAAIYASLDIMNIPRIAAPAEYQSAMIYALVHPTNIMTAVRWAAEAKSAQDHTGDKGVESTPVTPEKLFCLVCDLYDNEASLAAAFDKSVAVQEDKVSKKAGK